MEAGTAKPPRAGRCNASKSFSGKAMSAFSDAMGEEKPMSPEDTPRDPKLTTEQKQTVLAELEYQLSNLRPQAKGVTAGA